MRIEPNDLRKLADEIERDGLRAFLAKRKNVPELRGERIVAALRLAAAAATDHAPGVKGGPTEADPNRPYCKPDQSCCDFCCGN